MIWWSRERIAVSPPRSQILPRLSASSSLSEEASLFAVWWLRSGGDEGNKVAPPHIRGGSGPETLLPMLPMLRLHCDDKQAKWAQKKEKQKKSWKQQIRPWLCSCWGIEHVLQWWFQMKVPLCLWRWANSCLSICVFFLVFFFCKWRRSFYSCDVQVFPLKGVKKSVYNTCRILPNEILPEL